MSESETVQFSIEHTDTFGGEANYSWLNRYEIEAPGDISDLDLVRRAKRASGHNGVRCRRVDLGETIALYPCGSCTVIFITPSY
jgi:hypothetical protein